jgi:hypothetical protein
MDPNQWAMDIDSVTKQPWRAHLIVAVDNLGEPKEVRWTACGQQRTRSSHPHGWWSTAAGQLPLQSHAVHCGAESMIGASARDDVV